MHTKRDVNIEVYLHPTTLFVAKQYVPNTLTAKFARSDFRSNASVQGRPDSSYFTVNPNPLECARGRYDRATDPGEVLALRRCHDLNLHLGGRQGRNFLRISLADTGNIVVPSEGTLMQYRFIMISTAHILCSGRWYHMPLAPFSATERRLEDHVGTHDALGASSADVTI
jgi:hypothetical protein